MLDVLGYNTHGIINNLRFLSADETRKENVNTLTGSKVMCGNPQRWLFNESGLYKLALRSNKPQAILFPDWVTREVLPSTRKTGAYVMGLGFHHYKGGGPWWHLGSPCRFPPPLQKNTPDIAEATT